MNTCYSLCLRSKLCQLCPTTHQIKQTTSEHISLQPATSKTQPGSRAACESGLQLGLWFKKPPFRVERIGGMLVIRGHPATMRNCSKEIFTAKCHILGFFWDGGSKSSIYSCIGDPRVWPPNSGPTLWLPKSWQLRTWGPLPISPYPCMGGITHAPWSLDRVFLLLTESTQLSFSLFCSSVSLHSTCW